ncbi:MAG: HlyD family efflux transporter periplasmic adaptor subunit, partial [Bacteroidota bacterium]
ALQLDYLNRETRLLDLMNESQTVDMNMRQNEILSQQQLAESAYQLKLAKRVYQRNAQLVDDQMVSREEYLNTRDDYEYQKERLALNEKSLRQDTQLRQQRIQQLNGSIRRMENQLDLSRNTLNNLYMLSPAEGLLSAFRAEIGEAKQVGDNVGQIDDLSGFKIRARIDQHYISKVYTGLRAQFEFGGKNYDLLVKKIYPEVNQGEFQIDLDFVNGRPERIRRGQSLQIRLELSDASESLLLPKGSFYQKTGGNWIFVWEPSERRARRRNIRIGRQNPEYFEVLEGLKEGEKVIISSYQDYEAIEMIQAK